MSEPDFKPLQDTDPMPFGKYGPRPRGEGQHMQDVPAKYLFWLWSECGLSGQTKTSPVADYIKRNLDELETEWPDGIWRA